MVDPVKNISLNEGLEDSTRKAHWPQSDAVNFKQKAVDWTANTRITHAVTVDPKTGAAVIDEHRVGGEWVQNKRLDPIDPLISDLSDVKRRIDVNVDTAIEKFDDQLAHPHASFQTLSDGTRVRVNLADPDQLTINVEVPGFGKLDSAKQQMLQDAATANVALHNASGPRPKVILREPPPSGASAAVGEAAHEISAAGRTLLNGMKGGDTAAGVQIARRMAVAQKIKGTMGSGSRLNANTKGAVSVGGLVFAVVASAGMYFLVHEVDGQLTPEYIADVGKEALANVAFGVALDVSISKLFGSAVARTAGGPASWALSFESCAPSDSPERQLAKAMVHKYFPDAEKGDLIAYDQLLTQMIKVLDEPPIDLDDPSPFDSRHDEVQPYLPRMDAPAIREIDRAPASAAELAKARQAAAAAQAASSQWRNVQAANQSALAVQQRGASLQAQAAAWQATQMAMAQAGRVTAAFTPMWPQAAAPNLPLAPSFGAASTFGQPLTQPPAGPMFSPPTFTPQNNPPPQFAGPMFTPPTAPTPVFTAPTPQPFSSPDPVFAPGSTPPNVQPMLPDLQNTFIDGAQRP